MKSIQIFPRLVLERLLLIVAVPFFIVLQPSFAQESNSLSDEFERWVVKKKSIDSLAVSRGIPTVLYDSLGQSRYVLLFFDGDIPRYVGVDDETQRKSISTNKVYQGAGFNLALTGANIRVGIWDGGAIDVMHNEFVTNGVSRATQIDGATYTPPENEQNSRHAVHVAGIIGGAGLSNRSGDNESSRGMAVNATIRAYDFTNDYNEMTNASVGATSISLSNHSYGVPSGWRFNKMTQQWDWLGYSTDYEDRFFGRYDDKAQLWDQLAVQRPYYTIVKSSGNDKGEGPIGNPYHPVDGSTGYDCISSASTSKNIITVGNIEDLPNGWQNAGGVQLYASSSTGPTDDGRIKPDIVANGVNVYSADLLYDLPNRHDFYQDKSGTSMAAPSVTGSIALLLEHQSNLHGTNQRMRASTVKGLVIHTADECGTSTGPDYSFGWGVMNTLRAAQVMSQDENLHPCGLIREYTLHNGETIEYIVEVPANSSTPLRATLCWTDPAGTPIKPPALNDRTAMLVNNLDLRLIKLSGNIQYYPYKLDPNNPANAATSTSDNDVDNVEMVHIASPSAGLYKVRVTHKGTLSANQKFSLIVTGQSTTNTELTLGTETVTTAKNYYASERIVHNAGTQFIVASSGDVDMIAGDEITLRDGFEALYGSSWIAHIVPCIATQYSSAKPQDISRKQTDTSHYTLPVDPQDKLLHFYPNPTMGESTIEYYVEELGRVEIGIYDVLGQLQFSVTDIPDHKSGWFQTVFNSYKLDVGTYLCKVKTPTKLETTKFSVMK